MSSSCCALAAVLVAPAILSQAAADPADCTVRGGTWNAGASRCELRVTAAAYTESLQLPTGLPAVLQKAVDNTVAALRAKFEGQAAQATADYPFWLKETYAQTPGPTGVTNIDMTLAAEVRDLHPVVGYRTLVFQGDRRLGLADLFQNPTAALSAIYPLVKADLERQLHVDPAGGPKGSSEMAEEAAIVNGTGTDPENYQYFVLAPDELLFHFLPYQVAAYAAGSPTVHIPLSQIQDLLAPSVEGR